MTLSPALPNGMDAVGRVVTVGGSNVSIEVAPRSFGEQATVGKFVGITVGKGLIIGLITEVTEEPGGGLSRGDRRRIAHLDLTGEIDHSGRFQRGISDYPNIGDGAVLLGD